MYVAIYKLRSTVSQVVTRGYVENRRCFCEHLKNSSWKIQPCSGIAQYFSFCFLKVLAKLY